jgi:hypothetical protein
MKEAEFYNARCKEKEDIEMGLETDFAAKVQMAISDQQVKPQEPDSPDRGNRTTSADPMKILTLSIERRNTRKRQNSTTRARLHQL